MKETLLGASNVLPSEYVELRTSVIRIGLALLVNLSRILQNQLALKLLVFGQVQCSVSSRTSNQARSKGLDADMYCK